jgi:hypothetical protein
MMTMMEHHDVGQRDLVDLSRDFSPSETTAYIAVLYWVDYRHMHSRRTRSSLETPISYDEEP